MSVKRLTDPVYLQFIWSAIETFCNTGSEPTFAAILSYIRSHCDPKCTESKLNAELSNAVRDGCVKLEQQLYRLIDVYSTFQRGRNDWYCYECHGPGRVVPCPTCFRVFHADCLSTASETHWSCRLPVEDPTVGSNLEPNTDLPPNHPCPVCQRLHRAAETKTTSTSDLQKIFCSALDWIRSKLHWRTMQNVGYLYEPRRNDFLVFRQINTRMIGDKMRNDPTKDGYPNRTSLLVELDNLVHNATVLYGSKNDMSNMARQIRSQLRRAMRESVFCVDCYLRPSSIPPVARLTAPCRVPHRLLWFQHNGWSFRPCKMLYESAEGYEVVCFGGRHEREFVPRSRAVDMTFTVLELGLRLTPSLKKALDEAEEYKANQSAYDRGLPTTSVLNNKIPTPRKSRDSDKCSSNRHSPASSGDKSKVRNRKRKAGPKYNSAFGSVDSGSTVSANSSTVVTEPKRRKPNRSASSDMRGEASSNRSSIKTDSFGPPMQDRFRNQSSNSPHEFSDDDSLSSSSLDSDSDADTSPKRHMSLRTLSMVIRPTSNPTVSSPPTPPNEPSHTVGRVSGPLGHPTATTTITNNARHSDCSAQLSSLTAKASPDALPILPTTAVTANSSKPPHHRVIRIKPLPVRPTQCDHSDPLSSAEHTPDPSLSPFPSREDSCKPRAKSKKPCASASSSSASSALSYPSSSGHATIPAVASSLDGHVSSDSVHSSSASGSTVRISRAGRPSKHTKLSGSTDVTKTHHVARSDHLRMRFTTKTSESVPDVSKAALSSVAATNGHARSASSLSSLPDSDSSPSTSSSASSSPLTHSRTPSPSSSELSSSVSSNSTASLPSSPARRHAPPYASGAIPASGSVCRAEQTQSIRRDLVFGGYEPRTQLTASGRGPGDRRSPSDSLKPLAKVAPTLLSGSNATNNTMATTNATSLERSPSSKTVPKPGRHHRVGAPSDPSRAELEDSMYGESDHNSLTMPKSSKKRSHPTMSTEPTTVSPPRAVIAVTSTTTTVPSTPLQTSVPTSLTTSKLTGTTTAWAGSGGGTRIHNFYGNHTPMAHNHPAPGMTTTTTTTSAGPTPPFSCSSSSSSSASSCYSSVSPAALSTTSGLGSSVSDPKSVDASPGEVAAAMLGNAYFSCCPSTGGSGNSTSTGVGSNAQPDAGLLKSLEERIHRIYADRLIALTTERDQAREEVNRQTALINKLRRDHEAEIKRVKQHTWCQVCLNEAFYHCCPGTAYCSKACQWQHWEAEHSQSCRRRAEAQLLQQQQQQQQQDQQIQQQQSQPAQQIQRR